MINKKAKIFVAGHTGLVGSAILSCLKKNGFGNLVARTRQQLDLTDKNRTETFFAKNKPEYVFLAAGKVGGIYANSMYPAEFIYDNVMIQSNVINSAYRYKVKKLLFLSSSCAYPKNCPQPMKEEYLLTGPIEPTNEPFALAKLVGIKMCQAYNKQYKTNFIIAIPANVYGANECLNENAHVISALMNKFKDAIRKNQKEVIVWGSGKPKRDFLFVDDLAMACLFLMENYNSSAPINIGIGLETSIKELAERIKSLTGFKGSIVYDRSKPDGNLRRYLDISHISKLGWKPAVSLEEGLKIIYEK